MRFGFSSPLPWTVALGLLPLFAARPAAAEPPTMAKNQLYYAIGHCEAKSPKRYFDARDRAYAADPTIKTYAGKIEDKGIAKDRIAQCDRDMGALDVEEKRLAGLSEKADRLREACSGLTSVTDPRLAQAQAARAALSSEIGSYKGRYPGSDPTQAIAECDRRFAELKADDAKKRESEARHAAEEAARAQAEKRAAAERAAAEAQAKAAIAALRGDRAAAFKKYGKPDVPSVPFPASLRAPRWEYVLEAQIATRYDSRGEATGSTTAPCTHRLDFNGDKLTKLTKIGPGCPHL